MVKEKEIKTCDCKPGKTHIGVGGGILIFNEKREVLLLKRGKNARNEAGWWCKPGGTVEYGETTIKGMKREIKEETNLEVDVWGVLPNTEHILRKEGQHWLAVNFLANIKKGKLKNMEPHKHDELRWFAIDKLPKKLTKTTREPVKHYLEKKYIKL
ncbi:MAG: NUDIX domain-containing protein [Candidatus Moranbacteria bacterium]|nr:NUDIX domain-containing protein [Candidatus Moranbacteria bacterium]